MLDLINSVYPTADKNGNFSLTQDLKDRTDPRYTSQRENMRYDGMFGGGDFSDPTYAGMLSRAGLTGYENWAAKHQRIGGSGDNYGEIYTPTMADYAQAMGYDIKRKFLPKNKVEDRVYINGKPTNQVIRFTVNDRTGGYAALGAMALMGGAALAAGAGGGAGGAATAAGSTGGSLGGTLGIEALPAAGGFTTAESLGAGALNGLVISPEAAAAAGAAGGAAGAAGGGGGYSAGGTLGVGELPAAGGYTTPASLSANSLSGMNVAGASGAATGAGNFLGLTNKDLLQLGLSGGNALLGYFGNKSALNKQMDALRESNALQKYIYDQQRADNMPALQARNNGLTGYQNLLKNPGSITSDPGYQFGLDQGTKAIGSQAAANGSYYSGATLKALNKYGQDYGQSQFDKSLNRYGNLAGLGQVGATQIGQAGMNYGNQVGANILSGGNARGAATLGQYGAIQNGLNQFGGYMNYQDWLKQANGGG